MREAWGGYLSDSARLGGTLPPQTLPNWQCHTHQADSFVVVLSALIVGGFEDWARMGWPEPTG